MDVAIIVLALLSGVLQCVGYLLYIQKTLSKDIKPNGATWLMFSYGTALLTVLEWDGDARWYLLVLPVTCATSSILVAVYCYRIGTIKWPSEWQDKAAFVTDVVLTVLYVSAGILMASGVISSRTRMIAALVLLVCSNVTTFTSFTPLVRGVAKNPSLEHWLPWSVWTLAYATLTTITLLDQESSKIMLFYPVSCAIMHALVALLAGRKA